MINNKYKFGLCHLTWPRALNTVGIEMDKVSCYVNEVTFGKPLSHLRMGAGCQGTQLCVCPTPGPSRRGEGLKVESITNSQ